MEDKIGYIQRGTHDKEKNQIVTVICYGTMEKHLKSHKTWCFLGSQTLSCSRTAQAWSKPHHPNSLLNLRTDIRWKIKAKWCKRGWVWTAYLTRPVNLQGRSLEFHATPPPHFKLDKTRVWTTTQYSKPTVCHAFWKITRLCPKAYAADSRNRLNRQRNEFTFEI